tara:strand:+ start:1303 stop:1410 length:108 start_codon:yes stop_codon:yes gene_type:complete
MLFMAVLAILFSARSIWGGTLWRNNLVTGLSGKVF